jgi:hypothetical protein
MSTITSDETDGSNLCDILTIIPTGPRDLHKKTVIKRQLYEIWLYKKNNGPEIEVIFVQPNLFQKDKQLRCGSTNKHPFHILGYSHLSWNSFHHSRNF